MAWQPGHVLVPVYSYAAAQYTIINPLIYHPCVTCEEYRRLGIYGPRPDVTSTCSFTKQPRPWEKVALHLELPDLIPRPTRKHFADLLSLPPVPCSRSTLHSTNGNNGSNGVNANGPYDLMQNLNEELPEWNMESPTSSTTFQSLSPSTPLSPLQSTSREQQKQPYLPPLLPPLMSPYHRSSAPQNLPALPYLPLPGSRRRVQQVLATLPNPAGAAFASYRLKAIRHQRQRRKCFSAEAFASTAPRRGHLRQVLIDHNQPFIPAVGYPLPPLGKRIGNKQFRDRIYPIA